MDSRNQFDYEQAYMELTLACDKLSDKTPCSKSHLDSLVSRYHTLIDQFNILPDAEINSDRYRQLSKISTLLAIYFFNTNRYLGAANYYLCSIQFLEHIDCSTKDFRKIVRQSLDLAECYINLARKDLAQRAIKFSMKAFSFIPLLEKTENEIAIGSPNDHFEKFYNHYQAQSSSPTHFKSTQFQNSLSLIKLMMENQQLEHLLSQLSLPTKAEEDLPDMLEAMTLEQEEFLQLELPKLSDHSLDDDQIRQQVGQYLSLALEHRNAGNKTRQFETYEQILTLYNRISNKTRADEGVILSLTQELKKREPASQPARLFHYTPAPAANSSTSSNRMDLS